MTPRVEAPPGQADVAAATAAAIDATAAALRDSRERVAQRIATALVAAHPELPAELAGPLETVCRAATDRALDQLDGTDAGAPAADTPTLAREFVHRRRPLDELLRLHRAWHAAFAREWRQALRLHAPDPLVLAAATADSSSRLFDFVGRYGARVTDVYNAEVGVWARSEMNRRQQEVAALLAGRPADARRAGERLAYGLEQHHLAFVVWSRASDLATLDRLAAAVGAAVGAAPAGGDGPTAGVDVSPAGAALRVPADSGAVQAWVVVGPGWSPAALPAALETELATAEACVAVGEPADGLDGFRASHAQALGARRVAIRRGEPHGGCLYFRDVRLLTLATHDAGEAESFLHRELGPLREDSPAMRRLGETVRVFLDAGSSYVHAGRRLGVHENTVRYRVRRASDLLGRPLDVRTLDLHVALLMQEQLRRVPAPVHAEGRRATA